MISNKFLFDKANQNIGLGAALPELNITQLSSLATTTSGSLLTVATLAALPNVVQNLGRLVYVVAENKYYYSDGVTWNINYSSEFTITARLAYGWGTNNAGEIGDNTSTSRSSPVTVVGGITNWSQLSGGFNHSLGVTTTGIAYGWGNNFYGRVGDGTNFNNRLSPVSVVGGITNWSRVAAGGQHSLGLTSTGIAYGWGRNYAGQLGTGNITDRLSPVIVVGGITNWSQLAAGASHSLGVTSTGIAYAWGDNNNGNLGDGTSGVGASKSSPVTVIGGITNWTQVSAGAAHSLGLTSTGVAYAWGYNGTFSGRLGDGTGTNRLSPVSVVGGITNWSQLSAGRYHSLGLTSTGIAYAWGSNDNGRLGDGTTTAKSSPVTVIGGITNWSQLSGGVTFSVGLTGAGVAYAWGYNGRGNLGDGTTTNRSSPVTVVGGITTWSQLSAGTNQILGVNIVGKGF